MARRFRLCLEVVMKGGQGVETEAKLGDALTR